MVLCTNVDKCQLAAEHHRSNFEIESGSFWEIKEMVKISLSWRVYANMSKILSWFIMNIGLNFALTSGPKERSPFTSNAWWSR